MMKLTTTTSTAPSILLTTLALVATSSAASHCDRKYIAGGYYWEITMQNVGRDNIERHCGRLWENLKGMASCMVYPPNGCESSLRGDDLFLWMTTSIACSKNDVHKAFHGANRSRFGPISCTE
ncbi:hypothetical protein CORC01_00384 [Colletotrichum orchidophilum]|uniref:Uncharacterized protein n=1 Tax=Colletotrichum orchidophilum TaxID=1209926 RepID=A0A1G4BRX2_9PEZI|nr:uncharacterized protein CORC01_00384 [Colletotrichum orchidophilum]OHF04045.1 hypothetical protein CORC01_00384 [Colletotrichum orchidophilum]